MCNKTKDTSTNSIPLAGLWLSKTACSKATEGRFRQSVPFSGAEQAEVGQLPYLLALCYCYRGFKYPPGILWGTESPFNAINRILHSIPAIWSFSYIGQGIIIR